VDELIEEVFYSFHLAHLLRSFEYTEIAEVRVYLP
jgi:hypothetical protein